MYYDCKGSGLLCWKSKMLWLFLFLKNHNCLCGRLADSNYFYTEESTPCINFFLHIMLCCVPITCTVVTVHAICEGLRNHGFICEFLILGFLAFNATCDCLKCNHSGASQCISCMYRDTAPGIKLFKNSVCTHILKRCSFHDFKTAWLSFPDTSATNLDTIIWDHPFCLHIHPNNPAPKSNRFV